MGGRYCAINSPRGSRWGQKSRDQRSRDFCPHRGPSGELIAQYRPPMSFCCYPTSNFIQWRSVSFSIAHFKHSPHMGLSFIVRRMNTRNRTQFPASCSHELPWPSFPAPTQFPGAHPVTRQPQEWKCTEFLHGEQIWNFTRKWRNSCYWS